MAISRSKTFRMMWVAFTASVKMAAVASSPMMNRMFGLRPFDAGGGDAASHDGSRDAAAGVLITQRNPRWLVEVSIASACRAAGR
jgi:hypothetical protein